MSPLKGSRIDRGELIDELGSGWKPGDPNVRAAGLTVWAENAEPYRGELEELRCDHGLDLRYFSSGDMPEPHTLNGSRPQVVATSNGRWPTDRNGWSSEQGVLVLKPGELYERVTGRVALTDLSRDEWAPRRETLPETIVRRTVDVLVALVGLTVSLPIMIPIAMLIWLEDRHSVFYVQDRLRRDGRPFRFVKLRTMTPCDGRQDDAPWHLTAWQDEEMRFTRIGRVLRATKLDEIPQLLHVLRGHTTLVGPRAESPEAFRERCKMIPGYRHRLSVTPGIIPWGFLDGYATAEQKLQCDLYFIKHRSLRLSAGILARTARRLFLQIWGRSVR